MTDREKAIEVLSRTGQPSRWVDALSDTEILELANVHNLSVLDETNLAPLMGRFWADREARLIGSKATSDIPQAEPVDD
jgi:hypothetical protein